eukprot:CAMPEP_0114558946 /NCGR_PEP_ID=MMETSP0114-20121206/10662_1 /TAXON_ID=31324 /ORGANISM="Goniomonas sp, Strain m" /LENGTH=287 /DNA_ID=CAMNT_0001744389 /DNA_START=40 /DNA_END=903 /DNA_ORIENTATION=-
MANEVMLVVYLLVCVVVAVFVGKWAMKKEAVALPDGVGGADIAEGAVPERRSRLANMRQRAGAGAATGDDSDEEIKAKKIGKKKLEKLEAKEAKRQDKEAMDALRERRKQQESERENLRKEQDEEKERQRIAQEEEEEREKREIAAKEEADFNKWKDMFSVAGDGSTTMEEEQESQGLLQEFIDYIATRKVVSLEELGAYFGLRAQDVVNRVTSLESMGRITGVLDDRGKFIFITPEEMNEVAKFINLRGRVSIADIAAESNRLIDLKGSSVELPPPSAASAVEAAA